jgi:hypothetical protein
MQSGNPEMQQYSFRKEMESIDRWVKELAGARKPETSLDQNIAAEPADIVK